MIAENLPILLVVLPLIGAPLCVVLRNPTTTWAISTLICINTLVIAVVLLLQVLDRGTIRYALGDWVAPWGIEYVVDKLNAFILVIVAAIGAVIMPYAAQSVRAEIERERIYLFYALYLLVLAGLLGITITGDAFNIFVFLEISSLSSYALISLGRDRRALHAAYQYLVMGTIGATFFLIGVGMLYMMTGTLNIADLGQRVPALGDSRVVLAAFAFIFIGMSLKIALFPLHFWLPNAYAYAPSVVSVLLAGTATKVSIYVLIRFVFSVFGTSFAIDETSLSITLLVLALAAMFIASTVAIFQTNVKRLLAWSSIAQIGYIMLGLGIASAAGLMASLLHIFNHALMKGALFMAMGCVFLRLGSVRIEAMQGLGRTMPWTMAAIVVGGLSLIGLPPTAGFISKWYLVQAAVDKSWWWLVVLIVLSSLLALIYVFRVLEAAYFQPAPKRDKDAPAIREAPFWMLAPTWILVGANIYFGLETTASVDVATAAANALMGVR